MAIAPIDLQTLFTQLDKVAKTQGPQREGQVIQQAVQGVQIQKKAEELVQQVNQAQDTGEGAQKVNDRGQREQKNGARKERPKNGSDKKEKEPSPVLRDPNLGKKIDIRL